MTVTYTAEVATCTWFGCFLKLLFRWRGSIYKLVWLDLVGFLMIYYILNLTYRLVLNEDQKRLFEGVVNYCSAQSNLIPLSFVLGFYVTIVMTRWWNQYTSIPWPDPIAVFVSANVHGQDERGRVMRRTVMRYVCLCLTMALINISPRVKKRFPTLDNLVEAGLLVENERSIIDALNKKFPRHSKHWLPIVWAASIVTRARKEGRIRDDFAVKTIIDELNKFRGQCGLLISYDTISVPLVYTQVVTLAVYSYFLTSIVGQQWVQKPETIKNESGYWNNIDLYFPIFTTLQFFFYMGWLKVAESLINPFGEDDDDFEVNWMVDRNLQVSYMIVDEMHHEHPELIKDQYWDEIFPNELPYTVGSERFREEHPQPSTAKIEVSTKEAIPTNMSSVRVDDLVGKQTTQQQQMQQQIQQQPQTVAVNYKFPDNEEEADDTASGIHFTAGNGKLRDRHGSSPSLVSISGTLSRVNTVASALKRFLSRDDGRQQQQQQLNVIGGATTPDANQQFRLPGSVSSTSLAPPTLKLPGTGSMRITDQVIEEVDDEQMTITSMRGGADKDIRPNIRDIFEKGGTTTATTKSINIGPPPASAPVDMPGRHHTYHRTQSAAGDIDAGMQPFMFPPGGVDALLSQSAPARNQVTTPSTPNTIIGDSRGDLFEKGEKIDASTETVEDAENQDDDHDEFEKLRIAREKERLERQKQKLARSISTTQTGILAECGEIPLDPITTAPTTTTAASSGATTSSSAEAQSSENRHSFTEGL